MTAVFFSSSSITTIVLLCFLIARSSSTLVSSSSWTPPSQIEISLQEKGTSSPVQTLLDGSYKLSNLYYPHDQILVTGTVPVTKKLFIEHSYMRSLFIKVRAYTFGGVTLRNVTTTNFYHSGSATNISGRWGAGETQDETTDEMQLSSLTIQIDNITSQNDFDGNECVVLSKNEPVPDPAAASSAHLMLSRSTPPSFSIVIEDCHFDLRNVRQKYAKMMSALFIKPIFLCYMNTDQVSNLLDASPLYPGQKSYPLVNISVLRSDFVVDHFYDAKEAYYHEVLWSAINIFGVYYFDDSGLRPRAEMSIYDYNERNIGQARGISISENRFNLSGSLFYHSDLNDILAANCQFSAIQIGSEYMKYFPHPLLFMVDSLKTKFYSSSEDDYIGADISVNNNPTFYFWNVTRRTEAVSVLDFGVRITDQERTENPNAFYSIPVSNDSAAIDYRIPYNVEVAITDRIITPCQLHVFDNGETVLSSHVFTSLIGVNTTFGVLSNVVARNHPEIRFTPPKDQSTFFPAGVIVVMRGVGRQHDMKLIAENNHVTSNEMFGNNRPFCIACVLVARLHSVYVVNSTMRLQAASKTFFKPYRPVLVLVETYHLGTENDLALVEVMRDPSSPGWKDEIERRTVRILGGENNDEDGGIVVVNSSIQHKILNQDSFLDFGSSYMSLIRAAPEFAGCEISQIIMRGCSISKGTRGRANLLGLMNATVYGNIEVADISVDNLMTDLFVGLGSFHADGKIYASNVRVLGNMTVAKSSFDLMCSEEYMTGLRIDQKIELRFVFLENGTYNGVFVRNVSITGENIQQIQIFSGRKFNNFIVDDMKFAATNVIQFSNILVELFDSDDDPVNNPVTGKPLPIESVTIQNSNFQVGVIQSASSGLFSVCGMVIIRWKEQMFRSTPVPATPNFQLKFYNNNLTIDSPPSVQSYLLLLLAMRLKSLHLGNSNRFRMGKLAIVSNSNFDDIFLHDDDGDGDDLSSASASSNGIGEQQMSKRERLDKLIADCSTIMLPPSSLSASIPPSSQLQLYLTETPITKLAFERDVLIPLPGALQLFAQQSPLRADIWHEGPCVDVLPTPTPTIPVFQPSISSSLSKTRVTLSVSESDRTISVVEPPEQETETLSKTVRDVSAALTTLSGAGAVAFDAGAAALDTGRALSILATTSRCSGYFKYKNEILLASKNAKESPERLLIRLQEMYKQYIVNFMLHRELSFPESIFGICFSSSSSSSPNCLKGAVFGSYLFTFVIACLCACLGLFLAKRGGTAEEKKKMQLLKEKILNEGDDDDDESLLMMRDSYTKYKKNRIRSSTMNEEDSEEMLSAPFLSNKNRDHEGRKRSSSSSSLSKMKQQLHSLQKQTSFSVNKALRLARFPFFITQSIIFQISIFSHHATTLLAAPSKIVLDDPQQKDDETSFLLLSVSFSDRFFFGILPLFLLWLLPSVLMMMYLWNRALLKVTNAENHQGSDIYSRHHHDSPPNLHKPLDLSLTAKKDNNKSDGLVEHSIHLEKEYLIFPWFSSSNSESTNNDHFDSEKSEQGGMKNILRRFLLGGNNGRRLDDGNIEKNRNTKLSLGQWLIVGSGYVWTEGSPSCPKSSIARGYPGSFLHQCGSLVNKFVGPVVINNKNIFASRNESKINESPFTKLRSTISPFTIFITAFFAVVSSICQGIAAVDPESCQTALIINAVVAAIAFCFSFFIRPELIPSQNFISGISNFVLLVACCLAASAVVVMSSKDNFDVAENSNNNNSDKAEILISVAEVFISICLSLAYCRLVISAIRKILMVSGFAQFVTRKQKSEIERVKRENENQDEFLNSMRERMLKKKQEKKQEKRSKNHIDRQQVVDHRHRHRHHHHHHQRDFENSGRSHHPLDRFILSTNYDESAAISSSSPLNLLQLSTTSPQLSASTPHHHRDRSRSRDIKQRPRNVSTSSSPSQRHRTESQNKQHNNNNNNKSNSSASPRRHRSNTDDDTRHRRQLRNDNNSFRNNNNNYNQPPRFSSHTL